MKIKCNTCFKVFNTIPVAGLLLITCLACTGYTDQCGCTPDTKDPVCKAYYELKDDFDVRVICGEELEIRKLNHEVVKSKEATSEKTD